VRNRTRPTARFSVWRYTPEADTWRQVGFPRDRYEAERLAENMRLSGSITQVRRVGRLPR
jgi:hypothetical protein